MGFGLGAPAGLQALAGVQDPPDLRGAFVLALAHAALAEGEADGGAREPEGFPQAVLQVALVAEVELPVGVGLDDEAGGAGAHLGHEVELGLEALHRGRGEVRHRIPEEGVELAGGDAPGVGVGHLVDQGEDLRDPLAGEGRHEDHGRVLEEAQVLADPVLHGQGREGVLLHQVPLVHHDDHGGAGVVGVAGDDRVLVGDALHRVHQQQGDVGAGHGLLGLEDRELLGALGGLALAADAGGVDEAVDAVLHLEHRVHRVPGGAGHGAHEAPLVAKELIDERGLANVRPPHDRKAKLVAGVVDLGLLRGAVEGEMGLDALQQLGHAVPVGGGEDVHLVEPQLVEGAVRGPAPHAVDLVDDEDRGLALDADAGGDLGVVGVPAVVGVHHEDEDVGLLHGRLGDAGDALGDDVAPVEIQAAGVHQLEHLRGVPHLVQAGHPSVAAVPGHARKVVHQGRPAPGQPIEKSRLAHVGTTTQGDDGEFHGVAP